MSQHNGPPRVVIDTNQVLTALVFNNGRLNALRLAWQDGKCLPLLCHQTASELIRVLAYPNFKLSAENQKELLSDYLPYCTTVSLPAKLPKSIQCRDENDLPFLHLAMVGKSDFLISGDNDLLCLAGKFDCLIITADEFIKRFTS